MNDLDRQIMQMQAVGWSQLEIAQKLGLTQSAVSQRLNQIRHEASKFKDPSKAFWDLLLGAAAIYGIGKFLEELSKK